MDYRDLVSDKKDEQNLTLKLFVQPLLTGLIYGAGHFVAYLIINQRFFKKLKEAVVDK